MAIGVIGIEIMKWIRLILEMLSGLFRWRANVTSPEKDWQKKHDVWAAKLEILENAERKAAFNYKLVALGESVGDSDKLWAKWMAASGAVNYHRVRQPKRPVC